jgi:hypothetical protein
MYKNKTTMLAAIPLAGILTLSVLAAVSSTNQAFAQAQPTTLSVSWHAFVACCKLTGELLIGGPKNPESKGVGGATITLHGLDGVGTLSTKTNSDGVYSFGTINVPETGSWKVKADFAGNSEYESSSATTSLFKR